MPNMFPLPDCKVGQWTTYYSTTYPRCKMCCSWLFVESGVKSWTRESILEVSTGSIVWPFRSHVVPESAKFRLKFLQRIWGCNLQNRSFCRLLVVFPLQKMWSLSCVSKVNVMNLVIERSAHSWQVRLWDCVTTIQWFAMPDCTCFEMSTAWGD